MHTLLWSGRGRTQLQQQIVLVLVGLKMMLMSSNKRTGATSLHLASRSPPHADKFDAPVLPSVTPCDFRTNNMRSLDTSKSFVNMETRRGRKKLRCRPPTTRSLSHPFMNCFAMSLPPNRNTVLVAMPRTPLSFFLKPVQGLGHCPKLHLGDRGQLGIELQLVRRNSSNVGIAWRQRCFNMCPGHCPFWTLWSALPSCDVRALPLSVGK